MSKKATNPAPDKKSSGSSGPVFVPTASAKAQANKYRMLGVLFWVIAIIAQLGAIFVLAKAVEPDDPLLNTSMPIFWVYIIGLMVVDLIFVIIGSQFWKKSNRLDPPSEKNKLLFMLQSQLGVVAAIVAFLPLVIYILTKKDLDPKHKTILASIAGVFMAAAVIPSIDFDPPSQEKYAEQSAVVRLLMNGDDKVFWTDNGAKYHLYDDCGAIKNRTQSEGTVQEAREKNTKLHDLCTHCKNRAMKEPRNKDVTEKDIEEAKERARVPEPNDG